MLLYGALSLSCSVRFFFFFNDTATTEIYTLSLHDAFRSRRDKPRSTGTRHGPPHPDRDRKSTRLNSSHANISYAVFCLKKKKKQKSSHLNQKKKKDKTQIKKLYNKK